MRLGAKIVLALSITLLIMLGLCVSIWTSTERMHQAIETLTSRHLAEMREQAALQTDLQELADRHAVARQHNDDASWRNLEAAADNVTRHIRSDAPHVAVDPMLAVREGERLEQRLVYFAEAALLASVALMVLGLRGVVAPLQKLVGVTREVTRGDLMRAADEHGHDEFGELGRSLNQMVGTLRQQLADGAQQTRTLEEANRAIQRELMLAGQVQTGLMPQQIDIPWLDFFAHIEPAREIGGDFYDVHRWEGGRVGVVIGDVSGRGVPAALMMVLSMSMLREAAQAAWCDPVDILRLANRSIRGQFPDNARDHFVTVCYLALEPTRLRLANAGHERPILWRAADGSIHRLEERGLFLVLFEDVQYKEMEAELAPGDKVILYTDGIVESRNAAGDWFGEERLLDLVRQNAARTCRELGTAMLEAVRAFHAASGPRDDVSIVVLEIKRSDAVREEA